MSTLPTKSLILYQRKAYLFDLPQRESRMLLYQWQEDQCACEVSICSIALLSILVKPIEWPRMALKTFTSPINDDFDLSPPYSSLELQFADCEIVPSRTWRRECKHMNVGDHLKRLTQSDNSQRSSSAVGHLKRQLIIQRLLMTPRYSHNHTH